MNFSKVVYRNMGEYKHTTNGHNIEIITLLH